MGERHTRWVMGREYSPESISALILAHLKSSVERRLGGPLENVVITVPALFDFSVFGRPLSYPWSAEK